VSGSSDSGLALLVNILGRAGFSIVVADETGFYEAVPADQAAQLHLPFASSSSAVEAEQNPEEDDDEDDEDEDDEEYMGAKAWQD
jgi:uncharacterized protein YaiL (DUF2058 family)